MGRGGRGEVGSKRGIKRSEGFQPVGVPVRSFVHSCKFYLSHFGRPGACRSGRFLQACMGSYLLLSAFTAVGVRAVEFGVLPY